MQNVVLVTGGSRGIGAATARLASERGYAVAVNYFREKKHAEALVAEIQQGGGTALAVQADVAQQQDVAAMFDQVEATLGPIRALVNNAGITGKRGPLVHAAPHEIRRVLEVNVLGVIWCAQEAVRRMSRRTEGGVIVNLSSGAATIGSPHTYVWYAASKAAIDGFTLGLAKEVAQEGIRVVAVAPGIVSTDIHAQSGVAPELAQLAAGIPVGRLGTPEEIAQMILWLLSGEASYTTGAIFRVAGGR